MSLQGLISGAECAVPFNPLSQVLKHTEGDRSLQQDRVAGPSGSRLHHLPGSSAQGSQQDLHMARQFFDGPQQQGGAIPTFVAPHHVLPPDAERFMHAPPHQAPAQDLSKAWNEMQQPRALPMAATPAAAPGAWSAEFDGAASQMVRAPGPMQQQQQPMNSYLSSAYMQNRTMPMGMSGFRMGMPQMGGQALEAGKGKGKEIDFAAAFAQADASLASQHMESARITEVVDDGGVDELADSLQEASLDKGKGKKTSEEALDFQQIWEQLRQSDIPPPPEEMAKWEAQFNQMMNSQREDLDFDYGGMMQNAWDGMNDGDFMTEPPMQFDEDGIPVLDSYVFEKDNKYLDPSHSKSRLQEAKDLLARNGSLSEAALLLEAAIQHGDLGEGGYETWILLGETRSMDERDDMAMPALIEGVKRAEAAGAAGAGMIPLAISFTNESIERGAHAMLLRWLAAHDPSAEIPPTAWTSLKNSAWHSQEEVTAAFLAVARAQYARGAVDADVQTGLGVLFYTSGDFARAKDCFEAALGVRPGDYTLWNRLGSSLSNGNKPEEALGAYREALQLRPTYTRAIYNVGVACLNIGANQEAIEHFLSALALQESSGGGKSEQLWTTLRRAFQSLNLHDMAEMAKPGADLELFRAKGYDF